MTTEFELKILFTKEMIAEAVERLAGEIRRDYAGQNPLLIGVLKGSFIFMADLVRQLDMPLEVNFIHLSSYGSRTNSSGEIKVMQDLPISVQGRQVLVIEDIVDTGLTTSFLVKYLQNKGAASVKLCSLSDKPSRRQVPLTIDYLGFTLPDKFVVGYGMDWNEKYRNLPDIRYIEVSE
jgi:hypoxanthine phosphoribosyltransferase